MTYPTGKVAHDHHHHADKARAKMINIAAIASALIVTIIYMIV
jgi:hypothetical protein